MTLVPEGSDPARQPHLRGRGAAHGAARRARPAAERDRVARIGRRRLPRQDGHADRAGAARRRASSGRTRRSADELGRYAASAPARNATLEAIAARVSGRARSRSRRRCRSRRGGASARSGSAASATCSARPSTSPSTGSPSRRPSARSPTGAACSPSGRAAELEADAPGLQRGLVLLAEQLRPEARETVEWFRAQGVELKVLSGDRPETVAAIARDAGIDGPALDASELPDDPDELRRIVLEHAVLGRISPDGQAARRRGAARRGPLRGDGRRRRQRRAGAEGGAARDRAGNGDADGAERRRRRARARRLRGRAGDGRRRAARSCATSSASRSCS